MDLEYVIGERCPHLLTGGGMRVSVSPTRGDNGLEIIFLVSLSNMHPAEKLEFQTRPIKIGILPIPPLVFLVLTVDTLKFDAPFGIGLYDREHLPRLLACVEEPRNWSVNMRRPITLIVVEETTQIIEHIRTATLTQPWWVELADALMGCSTILSQTAYRTAINAAYDQWPTPASMISDCTIIEVVGI